MASYPIKSIWQLCSTVKFKSRRTAKNTKESAVSDRDKVNMEPDAQQQTGQI